MSYIRTLYLHMKRLIILAISIAAGIQGLAQGVKAGPWVCDVREDRMTILWTSEVPGMAFVELADGSVQYEMFAGRRIFKSLHSITIEGLKRGETVRYRVGGQNLKDGRNARNPVFGDTYKDDWHSIKTLDSKARSCRFSVFNDIHMRTDRYTALAAQVDSAATDFLFLNGDIVSADNYVLDSAVRYAIEPMGTLPAGLPVFFARGNHEGRGDNVPLFAEIFPNREPAPFYYTFRQGPAAFIVFDGGETWNGRSVLYCGSDVYEEYLQQQIEWARKAVKDPMFRKAPLKVCILHVPMIDHEDKTDYLLQRWLNQHFVSLLNKAGIDIMIGADLHELMMCEAGTMGADFPILVNDDGRRLDVEYTIGGPLKVQMVNPEGEVEFQREFPIKK